MASVSCLPMTECFRLKQYHNSRETAVQQPQVMWGGRRQNDARLALATAETSVWLPLVVGGAEENKLLVTLCTTAS